MPAGLFASLAGAACEPMQKVCPVRRPRSILPGDSALEGCLRDPYAPSRAVCATSSRSSSLHSPPLPPPALKRTQRSASRTKSHHSLRLLPASSLPRVPSSSHVSMAPVRLSCVLLLPVAVHPPSVFPCPDIPGAAPPSRPSKGKRLCAQPAFFQPSRHLCAKKNDFVKKNANTALLPSSLPDNSACSPPERPLKTGAKNRKNQEITDFFRQSALTSPAKHVSVFSIAAGLQAVLGITCGVSVTFERVFFHVQVHLCWEPPLGRY